MKSKTNVKTATIAVDLGASFFVDRVSIYWGVINGVLRMPESLKIFNVDTSVCVASPKNCGDFISRVQPIYSKQKKYYLVNAVSKFNENIVYDDENCQRCNWLETS